MQEDSGIEYNLCLWEDTFHGPKVLYMSAFLVFLFSRLHLMLCHNASLL